MVKYLFVIALFIAFPLSAQAGEDCLGASIGPGCIGLDTGHPDHYHRVYKRPPHAHIYVVPHGHYYYDPDEYTYYYEDEVD